EEGKGVLDAARMQHRCTAELGEHVLGKEEKHRLILDDEDAQSPERPFRPGVFLTHAAGREKGNFERNTGLRRAGPGGGHYAFQSDIRVTHSRISTLPGTGNATCPPKFRRRTKLDSVLRDSDSDQ